jgi:DNA polymerase/3'-5' exonuclease PolX
MRLNDYIAKKLMEKSNEYRSQGNPKYHGYSYAAHTISGLDTFSIEDVLNKKVRGKWIGDRIMARMIEYVNEMDVSDLKDDSYSTWNQHKNYTRRSSVLSLISELIDYLNVNLIDYEIAGSYRRHKEFVGDIDILIYGKFPSFSGISAKVLARGPSKIKFQFDELEVDLRSVTRDQRGTALLYYTGSRQFNINMRANASRMGFLLNEYYVMNRTDKTKYTFDNEKDVFTFLKMEYVPPENRSI